MGAHATIILFFFGQMKLHNCFGLCTKVDEGGKLAFSTEFTENMHDKLHIQVKTIDGDDSTSNRKI